MLSPLCRWQSCILQSLGHLTRGTQLVRDRTGTRIEGFMTQRPYSQSLKRLPPPQPGRESQSRVENRGEFIWREAGKDPAWQPSILSPSSTPALIHRLHHRQKNLIPQRIAPVCSENTQWRNKYKCKNRIQTTENINYRSSARNGRRRLDNKQVCGDHLDRHPGCCWARNMTLSFLVANFERKMGSVT